jgi:MFS family permease
MRRMTPEARKWWTVAAMAFPLLLLTIDFFAITVALPSIGAKLGADASILEWTVNAYALGFAAPLTAVGRLGDIIGRRRVLLLGSLLFALASAGCGLAAGDWGLVAGRAGMALIALSFAVLMFVSPTAGVGFVVAGLIITSVGQGLAYNISTTAGMSAIPEQKAGAASGVLCTIRLLGLVLGVAATGALFKILETARLRSLLESAGTTLTDASQAEIRGLLSGAHGAKEKLSSIAPALAERMEGIVGEAFVYALVGGLGLTVVLALAGVASSFLVRRDQGSL